MNTAPSLATEAPIVLRYPVNLPFVGQVVSNIGTDLRNPYKRPMWVDEIRIQQALQDPNPLQNSSGFLRASSAICLRLSLNGKLMFSDFVPMSVLSNLTDPTVVNGTNCLLLRLPKPMWLDEGDQLTAELRFSDLPPPLTIWNGLNDYVAMEVTVLARLTDNANRPTIRHLPFACFWAQETPFKIGDPNFTRYRSPDSALFNDRKRNVHITRAHGVQQTTEVPMIVPEMRLQISNSQGGYICKDPTPMFELFSFYSSWLDQSFIMKPGDFWTVEVEITDGSVLRLPQALTGLMLLIGLTGYQTEHLPPL